VKKRNFASTKGRADRSDTAVARKIIVQTAGYAAPGSEDSFLTAEVYKSSCGHIKDGVVFSFGKHGGWLIAYDDLMKIADAAAIYRNRRRSV
jgi:hypothetical protein